MTSKTTFALVLTALVAMAGCAGGIGTIRRNARVTVENDHLVLSDTIHFATNSDQIEEESFELLEAVVEVLQAQNVRTVRVEGHTDTRGDADANQRLSQRRARAVADYLSAHGATQSFAVEGFGSSRPLCQDDTDECHYRNRRVEFYLRAD